MEYSPETKIWLVCLNKTDQLDRCLQGSASPSDFVRCHIAETQRCIREVHKMGGNSNKKMAGTPIGKIEGK